MGGVKERVFGVEKQATKENEYCANWGAPTPVFSEKFRFYTRAKMGLWWHLITPTLIYMGGVCYRILMFAFSGLIFCTA